MAATCPIDFDVATLRARVQSMYTELAREPSGDFHFHRGPRYAIERLGYDAAEIQSLPERATRRFAGVGNPLAIGPLHEGEVVLDHACGAGMDLLIAARRVGPTGRAIGVDMTPSMRSCAREAALEAGLSARVEVRDGLFEELPVEDSSVDVVISNGVLNLSPDKRQVLREVERVLRPGGRLYLADVVVQRELSLRVRSDAELWAACIGGALLERELHELCQEVGLKDAVVHAYLFSFAGTSAEGRVAKDLRLAAVHFSARKAG